MPSIGNSDIAIKKVAEKRQKYEKECESKYLKMYCFNDIKSLDDIKSNFIKTYTKEDNAFKLLFSFGYVCEKNDENQSEIKLFQPGTQYFYQEPTTIKSRKDMNALISRVNEEEVISNLANRFKDTKTRLIGVYSMAVKVIRLDYPIGSKIKLPDYIKRSKFIVGLENTDNNLCFWGCIALV